MDHGLGRGFIFVFGPKKYILQEFTVKRFLLRKNFEKKVIPQSTGFEPVRAMPNRQPVSEVFQSVALTTRPRLLVRRRRSRSISMYFSLCINYIFLISQILSPKPEAISQRCFWFFRNREIIFNSASEKRAYGLILSIFRVSFGAEEQVTKIVYDAAPDGYDGYNNVQITRTTTSFTRFVDSLAPLPSSRLSPIFIFSHPEKSNNSIINLISTNQPQTLAAVFFSQRKL